jgi:hypothetical protein
LYIFEPQNTPPMKKLFLLFLFAFCILQFAFPQTNVSGGIYANTTWTLANSPYIVVDTVVVFPGVTLTIEPGVVVKFENNKYLEIRQATLIANGTVTDSITFTSNSLTPTPGIWNNISLNNSPSHAYYNYCNVKYSNGGITGDTIRNSKFSFNNACMSYAAYIDSCDFINNGEGASGGKILHSIFLHNQIAIQPGFGSRLVKYCRVDSNQTAIYAHHGVVLENSTVNHNQIAFEPGDAWSSYKNCIIDSNSTEGVILYMSNDTVINCEIKGNATGVNVSSGYMSRNIIENNTIGIELRGSSIQIFCNRICNNSLYDLKYNETDNANVANNYWCTPDSISTEAVIYDGYDDVSVGLVTFMPLDVNNCYLTGCNLNVNASVSNATCDTCHNGSASVSISNGFPPYSYSWFTSPIQTTATATGLASGTYTVCVTDGHGCSACNYNVFVDSTNCTGFGVNATETNASCTACSDGMGIATVTAGSPPFNYTWFTSPIQTNDTATALPPGTYAVCVTDAYGCSACDTVTVSVGSCSAYYTITANGAPHTYDLTNLASGTPPLSYDWDWGDGSPHDTAAYPTHTYAGAGTYTICLAITDSAGCTSTYCHSFFLLTPLSPVYINVIPPISTGMSKAANEKSFSVYPNPATSSLIIKSKEPIDNVVIRSIDGRAVKSLVFSHWSMAEIDVRELSAGIYFIEVNMAGREKFVKE